MSDDIEWSFLGYVSPGGNRLVQDWYEGLDDDARDVIRDALVYLQKAQMALWREPDFKHLGDGLSEVRAKAHELQQVYRLYGFFWPQRRRYVYTFILGNDKKVKNARGDVLEARKRKARVERGRPAHMNLNSRNSLISRIRRSKRARDTFVASHIARTLAFQVRAMRQRAELTQKELGESIGSNQNTVYRLESGTASPNISYLKKLAAKFDVAIIVRFVPYTELIDWVSGTPRVERGLRHQSLDVPNYDAEFSEDNTGQAPDPGIQRPGFALGETTTNPLSDSAASLEETMALLRTPPPPKNLGRPKAKKKAGKKR